MGPRSRVFASFLDLPDETNRNSVGNLSLGDNGASEVVHKELFRAGPATAGVPKIGLLGTDRMTRTRLQIAAAAAALLMSGAMVQPALSGPAEIELLSSYIGSWAGEGVMVGGNAPEDFRCRLTVSKGTLARINYSGRCTLVNMNLSVTGTIAFNDTSRRYEAVMSSNAGFTGTAVGREQGEAISFNLKESQVDSGGNNVRIGAVLTLDGENINVDFEVEFNNSGQVLTTSVPFAR